MRTYELVLVLKTTLSEANRKKLVETVKGFLKDAKVKSEEEWGQKALSYPIKREVSGFYIDFLLELEKVPADFEKRLMANEDILRHLLIKQK